MEEHPYPKHKQVDFGGPMLLIGFGVILLLKNTGQLHFSLWNLIRLWPLFLIMAGLELILGRRSRIGAFVAAFLALALFVGGVWMLDRTAGNQVTQDSIPITIPRDDINALRARIAPAIAQIHIGDLDDSNNLVEGFVTPGRTEEIYNHLSEGDPAYLRVETENNTTNHVFNGDLRTWVFNFHRDLDLNLMTDWGIGDADLDLAQLSLNNVNVDFGIGQATLTLPDAGSYKVSVDGGIGMLHINVPAGAGVRIRTDTGIVVRDMPANYIHKDDLYTSPNYTEAEERIVIELDLGIGNITVVESRGD